MLKSLFIFLALLHPSMVSALKIDDTHYRFCVMDDAFITDAAAAEADRTGHLPFIPSADWYSYHGVKINGTETNLENSNGITNVKVLMTEEYDGSDRSLRHVWRRGEGGIAYQKTTYIYISVDAPTGISLKNTPSTMLIGDEKSISVSLEGSYTSFSGNGYFYYSYSSSNPDILAISSGKLSAKKEGKATITVKAYAKNRNYSGSYYIGSASEEIEVVNDLSAKTITIEPQNLDLTLGQEATILASLTPKEAETDISWSSSNENVVEVDNGHVKAIGKGKANVIARTSNGLTAVCNVTVSVAPAMAISDINCSWGITREQVIADQDGGYYLIKQDESSLVFKKVSEGRYYVYLSYKFDNDGKLCASALSMPENIDTKQFTDEFFVQYETEMYFEDGLQVKKSSIEATRSQRRTTI